jgi:hypothetical protein
MMGSVRPLSALQWASGVGGTIGSIMIRGPTDNNPTNAAVKEGSRSKHRFLILAHGLRSSPTTRLHAN